MEQKTTRPKTPKEFFTANTDFTYIDEETVQQIKTPVKNILHEYNLLRMASDSICGRAWIIGRSFAPQKLVKRYHHLIDNRAGYLGPQYYHTPRSEKAESDLYTNAMSQHPAEYLFAIQNTEPVKGVDNQIAAYRTHTGRMVAFSMQLILFFSRELKRFSLCIDEPHKPAQMFDNEQCVGVVMPMIGARLYEPLEQWNNQ